MAQIHKTAIVDPRAILGEDVSIGPYSIVKANAVIGDHTCIGSSCVIESGASLGRECVLFTGVIIGSITQDLKYAGKTSFVKIGDRNRIREYVTINLGTEENSETIIGNDNLLMAYVHVGHNSVIYNHSILANGATLAGHVEIENGAVVGGLSALHQFVRIGKQAIVGGCSKVVQDVIPYARADGHPAKLYGLNSIGLNRKNFSLELQALLKKAFKILFRSQLPLSQALSKLKDQYQDTVEVMDVVRFIEKSSRGICR
ncbi:acyl-ACP--UDP-N-acetylglucosamine O-acyltransferase [PVC group bacterium]|nr:acyl-ACP--UDP-N-acetylglucosamine O-acyltransferase [PVC group bacterium]